jgi:hypothetical protein
MENRAPTKPELQAANNAASSNGKGISQQPLGAEAQVIDLDEVMVTGYESRLI